VIDIHCHILPEVDDGAKSWEMAQQMCQMAVADGITDIVATPHANDRYFYDRESLQAMLSQLQEKVGDSPRLALGCDFHLSYDNLQAAYVNPENYVIEKTRYLLVELSNYSVPAQTGDCFQKLGDHGMTPVLTHPERNPILQSAPQRILEWAEQGCIMQVTASSFTGAWGEKVQQIALWLLEHEAVHVLATDAHDTKYRVPKLSAGREVVAEIVGADIADALVEGNPKAILNGQPLPYFPKPALKG
jgi:protein-tyrosine phosphatase